MPWLDVDYTQKCYITRKADPDDQWDADDECLETEITSVSLGSEMSDRNVITMDDVNVGDEVFLVWALYSTGDSFHTCMGCLELLCAFKSYDEALHFAGIISDADRNNVDYNNGFQEMVFGIPWNGYFESLEAVTVDSFIVKGVEDEPSI